MYNNNNNKLTVNVQVFIKAKAKEKKGNETMKRAQYCSHTQLWSYVFHQFSSSDGKCMIKETSEREIDLIGHVTSAISRRRCATDKKKNKKYAMIRLFMLQPTKK